jgi:AcrR family transcriptional regulator
LNVERAIYGTSRSYPALPRGRHLLPPEYVDQYQRRRLVVAVAELAHEEGLARVTVTGVVSRARISRKTFYDYFGNWDECVEYASQQAVSCIFGPIGQVEPEQSADQGIVAGVEALVGAVAAEPNLAELALIHAPALGGEQGRRFQEIAIEAVAGLLSGGNGDRAARTETSASAIIGVIACQVRRREAARAADLTDEVVQLAKLPAFEMEAED